MQTMVNSDSIAELFLSSHLVVATVGKLAPSPPSECRVLLGTPLQEAVSFGEAVFTADLFEPLDYGHVWPIRNQISKTQNHHHYPLRHFIRERASANYQRKNKQDIITA